MSPRRRPGWRASCCARRVSARNWEPADWRCWCRRPPGKMRARFWTRRFPRSNWRKPHRRRQLRSPWRGNGSPLSLWQSRSDRVRPAGVRRGGTGALRIRSALLPRGGRHRRFGSGAGSGRSAPTSRGARIGLCLRARRGRRLRPRPGSGRRGNRDRRKTSLTTSAPPE